MEDNIIRPTFAKRRSVPMAPLPPAAEAEARGRLRLYGAAGPHLVWVLYPETFGCGHEVKVLVGPRSGPIKRMAVMPATSEYNIAIELVADGVLRALKLAVGQNDGNPAA